MFPSWGVHRSQPWEYVAQLAYGVTSTRDPQTYSWESEAYADMVDAGFMVGPRLFMTGPGVYSSLKLSSREDTHDYLRRYSEFYKTGTLKNYHLGGGRKVQQWIIMEAIQQGFPRFVGQEGQVGGHTAPY